MRLGIFSFRGLRGELVMRIFYFFGSRDYSRGGGAGIRNQASRYEVAIVASSAPAAASFRTVAALMDQGLVSLDLVRVMSASPCIGSGKAPWAKCFAPP